MTYHAPPPLAAADAVTVLAPASAVVGSREPVQRGMAVLRSWGLEVNEAEHLWATHPEVAHLAGPDAVRAADLTAAWADPAVRAVFCARGGYGTQRTLAALPQAVPAGAADTWMVGFSDVTALLHHLARHAGSQSVHGPVLTTLADDAAGAESLRRLLWGEGRGEPLLTGLEPWRQGSARGPLLGGNVAVLAASVGTTDLLPARGAVVFVEDVGQPAFVLDRGLSQLVRSRWLDGVRGVVVGDVTMSSPPAEVAAVLRDRLLPLGVPVWVGGAFGHGPRNSALPFGAEVVLDDGELWLDAP
ncbi:MAG: S66 peptidase family protein [Phycicoccus sp.]